MTESRTVFIITPIGKAGDALRRRADDLLNHVIKPALHEYNVEHPDEPPLEAKRGDESDSPTPISLEIVNDIVASPFVIVDVAGHNPNVFYELGIADAFRVPTIRIMQPGERLPFDVQDHRTIEIASHVEVGIGVNDVADAIATLGRQIGAAMKPGFEATSVVTLAGQRAELAARTDRLAESEDPNSQALATVIGNLGALVGEIHDLRRAIEAPPEIRSRLPAARQSSPRRYANESTFAYANQLMEFVYREMETRVLSEGQRDIVIEQITFEVTSDPTPPTDPDLRTPTAMSRRAEQLVTSTIQRIISNPPKG